MGGREGVGVAVIPGLAVRTAHQQGAILRGEGGANL